jgi:hypothetical protein
MPKGAKQCTVYSQKYASLKIYNSKYLFILNSKTSLEAAIKNVVTRHIEEN